MGTVSLLIFLNVGLGYNQRVEVIDGFTDLGECGIAVEFARAGWEGRKVERHKQPLYICIDKGRRN